MIISIKFELNNDEHLLYKSSQLISSIMAGVVFILFELSPDKAEL
jgi:hypothetical protein